jgi:hypothetical protein
LGGSPTGPLEKSLLYTYAVFAFDAVLNPATPLCIAVVGLAVWSFAGLMPRIAEATWRRPSVTTCAGGRVASSCWSSP